MKKILSLVLSFSALVVFAFPAFAHEAISFDPTEPSCMGQMTSFHAKDPGKGLRHNYEEWNDGEGMPHTGIANEMSVESADTFQEFMKLNKMWCDSDME